jgi:hypothetical protein
MKTEIDYDNMGVFEQVKTGLEQVLAHGRGELSLKTTTLPAPPPPPPASRSKVSALRRKLGTSSRRTAAPRSAPRKAPQHF